MKAIIKKTGKKLNTYKLPIISAVIAVAVVSLPTYANHASNRAVEQPKQENIKVVSDTSETKNKKKQEQKKKTQKQQQKVAAQTTTKPQVYQAPKPEQKPVYQKPAVKKTYEKPKQKPSIQHVSVSLTRSGGSVVATIDTSKSGTCYFTFKDLSDKYNPRYKNVSASASNGRCSTGIPSGFTHAMVAYKAADYSAKGYSDKIAL